MSPDTVESASSVEAEEPAPRTLLLRIRDEFGAATHTQLADLLGAELDGPRISRILLDLSEVTALPPDGLRALRALRRRCRVENRHLVLVGAAHPAVHRPLRTSGLLPLFDTRPTVQTALRGRCGTRR